MKRAQTQRKWWGLKVLSGELKPKENGELPRKKAPSNFDVMVPTASEKQTEHKPHRESLAVGKLVTSRYIYVLRLKIYQNQEK